eukprot:225251-Pelagomonas_calceolata.AAC.1
MIHVMANTHQLQGPHSSHVLTRACAPSFYRAGGPKYLLNARMSQSRKSTMANLHASSFSRRAHKHIESSKAPAQLPQGFFTPQACTCLETLWKASVVDGFFSLSPVTPMRQPKTKTHLPTCPPL